MFYSRGCRLLLTNAVNLRTEKETRPDIFHARNVYAGRTNITTP